MNAKDILSRIPPELLYHYTTQAGLLGIIESKEIWASHTQYLNDRLEFRHALSVVQEELVTMAKQSGATTSRLLAEMQEGLEGIESINVCVCSFSEDGDTLSQWRAYGGPPSGFAVGFSGDFLRRIADSQNFWLVPCLYDEPDQRELVRTLLQDVLEENLNYRATRRKPRPGGKLVPYLNRYAPILKHYSFREEKEWRIISRPLNCVGDRFDYRPGTSMLVPYYKIPLSTDDVAFQIERIIVGPTPSGAESQRSVEGLLTRHELDDTQVSNSVTPYRNW